MIIYFLLNRKFILINKLKPIIKFLKLYYPLDFIRRFSFFKYRYHYIYINFVYKCKKVNSPSKSQLSDESFKKLVDSVKKRINYSPTGIWKDISSIHQLTFIEYLKNNDYSNLRSMLSNPSSNDLFYGFDNLAVSINSRFRLETATSCSLAADHFFSLAEYVGVVRSQNPERLLWPRKKSIEINPLIEKIIEKIFKKEIIFPNIYPGEKGISTKYGIASLRVPASIYQALKVKKYGDKICEIGPGLGRTAYFANLLGVQKYTLVDIPITSIAQSYFLLSTLRNTNFSLAGEKDIEEGIEFRMPNDFFNSKCNYDVVLNVDSLTEIGEEIAKKYIEEIVKRSKYFLSINHEANQFTISSLTKEFKELNLISRNRSWIREGYVEEIFEIKK